MDQAISLMGPEVDLGNSPDSPPTHGSIRMPLQHRVKRLLRGISIEAKAGVGVGVVKGTGDRGITKTKGKQRLSREFLSCFTELS